MFYYKSNRYATIQKRKNRILKFHKDTLRNEDNNQNYDNFYKGKNWFDDF